MDFFEDVEKHVSQDPRTESNLTSTGEEPPRSPQPTTPHAQKKPSAKPPDVNQGDQMTVQADESRDESFGDEFDDGDDTFAEEMQDLADKVDSQNQLGKISTVDGPAPMPPMLETIHELNNMDDAFDDDDDLWAQVADETAQGKAVIGSTSQVRELQ